jgi:hypothetical protein
MIHLQAEQLGTFMGKLFSSDSFDSFLLEEASIRTAVTWDLDGHLNKDFYTAEEWDDKTARPWDLLPWSEVRPLCRELIKGKKAPVSFRFVLQLKPEYLSKTLHAGAKSVSDMSAAARPTADSGTKSASDMSAAARPTADSGTPSSLPVSALLLNIRYDGSAASILTGISYSTFTLDKSAEALWDKTVIRFLESREIPCRELE